jgi:dTDP-D-glucose 4,6-dehydratase
MQEHLNRYETILVTGGAGFIGSNFIIDWLNKCDGKLINLDLLTYSGNMMNLDSLKDEPRHIFMKGDIGDRDLIKEMRKVMSTVQSQDLKYLLRPMLWAAFGCWTKVTITGTN